jgi:hypothetical protein
MAVTETKFCGLCGKHKPADDFIEIPLAMLRNGPFIYSACKSCETVIHNIRRIVKEAEKEEVAPEEKRRIIVPSVIVPKNLRS